MIKGRAMQACYAVLAVVSLTLFAGEASAQGTMQQRAACEGDAFRLCRQYIPDSARIGACLRRSRAHLSPACHSVMFKSARKTTKKRHGKRHSKKSRR